MAKKKGKGGVIRADSVVAAHVREWSIEENAATADSSTMDTTADTHEVTSTNWSGQVSAFWDKADLGQDSIAVGASITLDTMPEGAASGAEYYTGVCSVTQITRRAEHSGMIEMSFSVTGNGALATAAVV